MKRVGLKTGLLAFLVALAAVSVLLVTVPKQGDGVYQTEPRTLPFSGVSDPVSTRYLSVMERVSPGDANALREAFSALASESATAETAGRLLLEMSFQQFQKQAGLIKRAPTKHYDELLAHFAEGMRRMKASGTDWCHGPEIHDFLELDDTQLVPRLLDEFPYGSDQYDWAVDFSRLTLLAAEAGRDRAYPHGLPGWTEENQLQQAGLALGGEQWSLALQIASFANSEGQGRAKMREAVANMNVCNLGIAIETVSKSLPEQTRGKIWSDLMPELMIGNTPYVLYRVQDYFFIG